MKNDISKILPFGQPMGIPGRLLAQLGRTSPAAKAMHTMMTGAMSLDEKRRIVRDMQIDNLKTSKRGKAK